MNIAYVIPTYPPATSQPFVVNEMIEVQEAGHGLVVLGLYPGERTGVQHGTYGRLRPQHVLPAPLVDMASMALAVAMALRHPVRVLRTLAGLHRSAGANPWAHLKLIAVTPKALAAAWRLRRLGVEHVHAHFANQTADCAAIAGTVAGIPFSFTAHAYDIYQVIPRQRNDTLGWKLGHAARVFAVSEYAARLLRDRLPERDQGRVQVAYVGIPMSLFVAQEPAAVDGMLRLLTVARLCEKKGVDTLIEACGVLHQRGVRFALDVFGDGPMRGDLERRSRTLGLAEHVRFRGSVPQEQIAQAMRACHALVLPCRRDRNGDMDGIPTVFMEAMASGRPVVSCAVSGIPELVIDAETGLLVPPNDPVALGAALERLAHDDDLRLRLGARARALVERQHDQRRNAQRVLGWLVNGKPDAISSSRPLEASGRGAGGAATRDSPRRR